MELWTGFPHRSAGKESACNAGDPGLIPESGRSPGEGNGNPLQYSRLENPVDRGAWQAIVHRVKRVGHDLATKERERERWNCETNFFTIMDTSAIIFHSPAKAEVLIYNNKQLEYTQRHTDTHTCPSQCARKPETTTLSNLEGCRYSQLIFSSAET